MPATAVGNANGRSTRASTTLLPGKEYRTSTQATISPKNEFTTPAAKAGEKQSRYEPPPGGDATAVTNSAQLMPAVLMKAAASGTSTIRLRYINVKPSERPKPGMTERWAR